MTEEVEFAGWIGELGEVMHFLRMEGADTDEDGKFLIVGNIVTFMGLESKDAESVVTPGTKYLKDGKLYSLVYGLRNSSAGLPVYVIDGTGGDEVEAKEPE